MKFALQLTRLRETATKGAPSTGIALYHDGNETVSSVACNGDALSLVETDQALYQGRIEIWSLVVPDSGTHDVAIACEFLYSRSAHTGVSAFSGVNLSMPP